MNAKIVVYQLSHKFIDRREDIPENARQVVYYALAVGHHVGVMDCFSSLIEIPLEAYEGWLKSLPDGPGRIKMEGVVKWGEIEINQSHIGLIMPLLEMNKVREGWIESLIQCFKSMRQEPALYLMLRKCA